MSTGRIYKMSLTMEHHQSVSKERISLFHANPVLNKLSRIKDYSDDSCA